MVNILWYSFVAWDDKLTFVLQQTNVHLNFIAFFSELTKTFLFIWTWVIFTLYDHLLEFERGVEARVEENINTGPERQTNFN